MKTNKKIWTIGVLFSLIIILLLIKNVDASFFGDMTGGNKCHLWLPPGTDFNTDPQKCDQCGVIGKVRGLVPCTEYWCHSLGVDCNFDKDTFECTKQSRSDRRAPVIQDCSARDLVTTNPYKVNKETRKCIVDEQVEAYSSLAFYLTLDEAGICSISDDPSFGFDSAAPLLTDNNGLSRNQFFIYPTSSADLNCNGMCTFYVKCADFSGNIGDIYTLEFFVKEAPDRAPPMIFGYSLYNGAYIPLSITNIDAFHLIAFDNEGVKECKYAESSSADYNNAELMQCSDTIDMGVGGWKCTKNGGLDTPDNENKYYFKCKDINNNVMPNWEEFRLLKSENTLSIGITSPGSEVSGGDNNLQIGVSGYEQGVSSCRYDIKWREGGDTTALSPSTEMVRASEGIYSVSLNLLNSGGYDIKVECVDGIGQTASVDHNFIYRNEPLSFTFDPSSVASATQDNFLDVGLVVSGGRNGQGNTWQCKYKKVELDDDLNAIGFNDLNTVFTKSSPQFYSIRFSNLISGMNRFYVMCEDFDARESYYGEEYKINFNPEGLVVVEQGSSQIRTVGGGYEVDLYAVLSGGPNGDGTADCYYTDTYVHGIYDSFITSHYKSDKFSKGNVMEHGGKSARRYEKTVSIALDVPNDFYVRCVDAYSGTTNVMKHTIIYSPGAGVDTTRTCQELGGVFCDQGYQCVGLTIDEFYGSEMINKICCADSNNCMSYGGDLTKTCNEQGGNVCGSNQICDGQFIDSSDAGDRSTARCCKGTCKFDEDDTTPLGELQPYTSGGEFFVKTNKMAVCKIKEVDNWVEMTAHYDNRLHSTPVKSDKKYNVRCSDSQGSTEESTFIYS